MVGHLQDSCGVVHALLPRVVAPCWCRCWSLDGSARRTDPLKLGLRRLWTGHSCAQVPLIKSATAKTHSTCCAPTVALSPNDEFHMASGSLLTSLARPQTTQSPHAVAVSAAVEARSTTHACVLNCFGSIHDSSGWIHWMVHASQSYRPAPFTPTTSATDSRCPSQKTASAPSRSRSTPSRAPGARGRTRRACLLPGVSPFPGRTSPP